MPAVSIGLAVIQHDPTRHASTRSGRISCPETIFVPAVISFVPSVISTEAEKSLARRQPSVVRSMEGCLRTNAGCRACAWSSPSPGFEIPVCTPEVLLGLRTSLGSQGCVVRCSTLTAHRFLDASVVRINRQGSTIIILFIPVVTLRLHGAGRFETSGTFSDVAGMGAASHSECVNHY